MRYHYASVALPCLESRLSVECCFIQGEARKTGHLNISAVIGDRKKIYQMKLARRRDTQIVTQIIDGRI